MQQKQESRTTAKHIQLIDRINELRSSELLGNPLFHDPPQLFDLLDEESKCVMELFVGDATERDVTELRAEALTFIKAYKDGLLKNESSELFLACIKSLAIAHMRQAIDESDAETAVYWSLVTAWSQTAQVAPEDHADLTEFLQQAGRRGGKLRVAKAQMMHDKLRGDARLFRMRSPGISDRHLAKKLKNQSPGISLSEETIRKIVSKKEEPALGH